MFKSFSLLAVAACAGMAFTSCNNETDYYDPAKAEELVKASYAANFVRQYGEIKPDQSWDFSVFGDAKSTRAAITYTTVAGIEFAPTYETYYYNKNDRRVRNTPTKNVDLFNDFKEALKDGDTHEGTAAVLVAPANSFTIYPLDAVGAYTYDLYVKVGNDEPKLVFNKNWNGWPDHFTNGCTYLKNGSTGTVNMPGMTIKAEIGTPIQLYIKNIKNGDKYVYDNADVTLGTHNGMAIILNSDARPEGLSKDIMPDDAIIKYVGFEDTTADKKGDNDHNDLVVMIVGNPYTPEDIEIEEDEYDKPITIQKRYMIEDLGTTDDFDFNDVVVDVYDITTQRYKVYYDANTGELLKEEPIGNPTNKQKAIARCLGGTIDFTLQIGNTTWKKSEHANASVMWNTGTPTKSTDAKGHTIYDGSSINWQAEEYKFDVEGWVPERNNISVVVRGQGSNYVETEAETIIEFPQKGQIPMIIAFNTTKKWMVERVGIKLPWQGE